MPLIPMIQSHRVLALAILVVAATLAGCNGPRVVQEAPVLMTGDRVPMADDVIVDAQAREVAARRRHGARDCGLHAGDLRCHRPR